jgi:hypothetical protein
VTGRGELFSKRFLEQLSVSLPVEEVPAPAIADVIDCDLIHRAVELIGTAAAITGTSMAMTYMQFTAITR